MRNRYFIALSIILLFSSSLPAQSQGSPPVSTVVAVLEKALDSKTAMPDQEIILSTLTDVVVGGKIVIPKGSKLVGQTVEGSAKNKDDRKNVLAVRMDKAVTRNGVEIPLQAIIAAIKAPADDSLSQDPLYGMMHSNEPKMAGTTASSTASTGNLSAGSKAGSTAAVATAQVKGGMGSSVQLSDDAQGAIGYEGISISWSLTVLPALTIFVSKAKTMKFKAGSQVLLRMAEPQVPH